jgi:hypothetical protein
VLAPVLAGRTFELSIEIGPYEGDLQFVAERAYIRPFAAVHSGR